MALPCGARPPRRPSAAWDTGNKGAISGAAMTRAPHDLIFSIHIPKTGGTSFAEVLRHAYGRRVAFAYGPHHARTHPLLRELGKKADRAVVAQLAEEGVRVVHGHFAASVFADAVPDPSRYWIWLREPVERTISHFHFFKDKHAARGALGTQVAAGTLPLAAFAGHPAIRNLQARHVGPFPVSEFGFVGLTEHMTAGLRQLGLPAPVGRTPTANVNREKPEFDRQVRAAIAAENITDVAVYSEGLRVFLERERRPGSVRAPQTLGFVARTLDRWRTVPAPERTE